MDWVAVYLFSVEHGHCLCCPMPTYLHAFPTGTLAHGDGNGDFSGGASIAPVAVSF